MGDVDLLTVRQVAARLDVSMEWVRHLSRSGAIAHVELPWGSGKKMRLFDPAEVDRYMQDRNARERRA